MHYTTPLIVLTAVCFFCVGALPWIINRREKRVWPIILSWVLAVLLLSLSFGLGVYAGRAQPDHGPMIFPVGPSVPV